MDAKYQTITLGESVCEKLKKIYHHNEPWPTCYKKVAQKFTELKAIMRKFYVGKHDLDILKELIKYSEHDLRECFSNSFGTVVAESATHSVQKMINT